MAGIPRELLIPLKKAFLDCDEFQSHRQIRSLFDDSKLVPFKNSLPEADNPSERVDLIISYLVRKKLVSGENALLLFVELLRDRKDSEDDLHQLLEKLAGQLNWLGHIDPQSPVYKHEANPKRESMLQILELEQMYQCARSVAQISVPRFINGVQKDSFSGTAWLIAPGLALTCWHVIRARSQYETLEPEDLQHQVANSLLTFDFLASGRGIQYQVETLACMNEDLDYALLQIKDRDQSPLSRWGYLILDEEDLPLTVESTLFIIQHPRGEQKQGAFGKFVRQNKDETGIIYYRTPTEPGTSGAPILNRQNWKVIAMHHGEDLGENLRQGQLMSVIMSDLTINNPGIYFDIVKIQQDRKE